MSKILIAAAISVFTTLAGLHAVHGVKAATAHHNAQLQAALEQ